MNEKWIFFGTEEELMELAPIEMINEMSKGLERYKDLFGEDEYIRREVEYIKNDIPGALNLMIPNTNYFINLRKTSIVVMTLILDMSITWGVASAVLNIVGFDARSICQLKEREAEKCIYIEINRKTNRLGNSSMYKRISEHECVNNDMTCKYRKEHKCTITECDINIILESLTKKNVLTKTPNGDFKCNI